MVLDLCAGCALGLAQGMRHALEPDHMTAVTALLTESRTTRSGVRLALAWGTGHALTLVLASVVLCTLRTSMPVRLADAFELLAALMLVALGARALFGSSALATEHLHVAAQRFPSTSRPLVVGLVHGLAGSGALTAIAVSRSESIAAALCFVMIYAFGASCGMALFAAVARAAFAHLPSRAEWSVLMARGSAALSAGVGLAWGAPIILRLWL